MPFQPGSNFKAWVFRIARNTFLTGIRQSWRNTPLDPVVHASFLVGPANQEDGLYSTDLRNALSTLPLVQREALRLIVDTGLTYEEAANSQHVELGTIKSRVARARTALTRYFNSHTREVTDQLSAPPQTQHGHGQTRYELWKATGMRTIG
jgi:RNA polymerase sigma-70 factor (ECF subfamily)